MILKKKNNKKINKIATFVIGVATNNWGWAGLQQLWFIATIVVGVATIVVDCDKWTLRQLWSHHDATLKAMFIKNLKKYLALDVTA